MPMNWSPMYLSHLVCIVQRVRSREPLSLLVAACVTNQDHEVIENTWSRVKKITKLPNLKKFTRIEGYSGV